MNRQCSVMVTGGYLSQNMGSAAMSVVTARELEKLGYKPWFLSKYPKEDADLAARYGISIVPARQLVFTFLVVPGLAIVAAVPGAMGLVRRRFFRGALLCYDIGGITFSGARGVGGFLINATWLILPLLLRIPVVKGAQAIGPFDRWYLRLFAPRLLRKAKVVHARGAQTEAILKQHDVECERSADIAFLLEPETIVGKEPICRDGDCLVIPSVVVARRYDRRYGHGAYRRMIAAAITRLRALGIAVMVLPHCYRASSNQISNDLPLARSIVAQVDDGQVTLVNPVGRSPGELKTIVGVAAVCVTGRFHGMIASLGMGVPTIVTAWSHKYLEVMSDFGQENLVIPWQSADGEALAQMVVDVLLNRSEIRAEILARLPQVIASARTNFTKLHVYAQAGL